MNKRSHQPTWCHLFLLTLLCNYWFISLSSDFSVCLDWQAKWAELYTHTHTHSPKGEEDRLARKERKTGWRGGERALAPQLPFSPRRGPHPTGCTSHSSPRGRENWPVILIASWVAFVSCSVCLAAKHVVWFHLYCFVIEVSFCIIQNNRISFWSQLSFPASALDQTMC